MAALRATLATEADSAVEEHHYSELLRRRETLQMKSRALWSVHYELGVLLVTINREDWMTDLGSLPPFTLDLPVVRVEGDDSRHLPIGVVSSLSLIAALGRRFNVAKLSANPDISWRILKSMADEARTARAMLDQTLGAISEAELGLTSELRTVRNDIARFRRSRMAALIEPLPADGALQSLLAQMQLEEDPNNK